MTQANGDSVPAQRRFEGLFNYEKKLNPRVREVDEVILPIDVVDVEVVGISPSARPCFVVRKPITAVLESPIIDMSDAKMMFSSERCAEAIVGNTAVTSA